MITAWILAAMTALSPGRDHHELATSIAFVALTEAPLFEDDDDRRKTASLLVAVAFRESSFDNAAIGDNGRSFCAMQIHASSGGTRALLEDATACVRHAYGMLRTSMRIGGEANPLGLYASGPKYRNSEKARRVSRDRMWLAARLVKSVTVEDQQ